jgi:60 kDa SS-A/Ro ribonucleoprotein
VIDALDGAFYRAFGNIEATGKRWLLACDVSGSMDGGSVAGTTLTPREAVGALALMTAKVEPNYFITGFANTMVDINLSRHSRLDGVCQTMRAIPMGNTDCALPMIYALGKKLAVDVFVVLTDNETWAGKIHPSQALRKYREATGIKAKLIVAGMTATGFSIADPNDAGMMDVVGFDAGAPALMADFARY